MWVLSKIWAQPNHYISYYNLHHSLTKVSFNVFLTNLKTWREHIENWYALIDRKGNVELKKMEQFKCFIKWAFFESFISLI